MFNHALLETMKHIAGDLCVSWNMLCALDSRVNSACWCLVIDEKCLHFDSFTSLVIGFETRQYEVRDSCDVVYPDGVILTRGAVEGNRWKKVFKGFEVAEYEFCG